MLLHKYYNTLSPIVDQFQIKDQIIEGFYKRLFGKKPFDVLIYDLIFSHIKIRHRHA